MTRGVAHRSKAQGTCPIQGDKERLVQAKRYVEWLQTSEGKRSIDEGRLRLSVENFEQTANPIAAWAAYLEARDLGVATPEPVVRYFDRVATAVWSLMRQSGTMPRDERPRRVAEAFGFSPPNARGRKPDAFDLFTNQRDRLVAHYIHHYRGWLLMSFEKAVERAAEKYGVSESTAKAAWRRYRAELGPIRKRPKECTCVQG